MQDDVKEKCCWKIKRIFKNSKQKFIQTLWSTCLHKSCRYLISTVSTYSSWTIMRMKMQTRRKIFDQLSKISFAKKRHALNKYARAQMKNLVVKNVKQRYLIESNMSATAPLPSPPIQRWHLDRRDNPPIIIESPKKKRGGGKKSSALYDISGKKMMVSKRRSSRLEKKSIGRVRGSAAKMAAPHQAIPRRGWWHTHRWPRFCRFCRSFFFFFFPLLSPPQLSSTDSLSHGKRSLYSLVVGRLG